MTYWWASTVYEAFAITGVPIFLMLSGALLLQPSKVNEPIRVLLKKRLTRIGVAFAFWGAIYFIWSYFADHTAITVSSVIQGLLTGPYPHFWFLYLIAGFYLITPILRPIVAYAELKTLRYFVILWFLGVAGVPIFQMVTGFGVNNDLFAVGGYIGYFILGYYLTKVKLRSATTYFLMYVGIMVLTVFGTLFMNFPFHALGQYYFFFYTTSANVIAAATVLFIILIKAPADWPGKDHPRVGRVVHAISCNTLPIYLFHVIVLYTLERGYLFGFKLSITTAANPRAEIPFAAVVTLLITLALVVLMKKVPILKKLIG
jgi:surface polysaccharide O-acyltransferase-like enzyme